MRLVARRVYKNHALDTFYNVMIERWLAERRKYRRGELFLETGFRRQGAGHRSAFWDGYDGKRHAFERGSLASAAYAAGKDCAKYRRQEQREQRQRTQQELHRLRRERRLERLIREQGRRK